MRRWVLLCACTCIAVAQVRNRETPRSQLARVEGQVIGDLDDRPLRRVHVSLRPVEAGLTSIGVEGDDHGSFVIRDVTPGRYSLFAERDGYLPSSTCLRGALRMPSVVAIGSGQQITNLTFRLKPWAVLAGRVKFDDGEPAVGIRIDAYREYRSRGRRGFSIVTASRTNDHGEFRMHGLQPGSYFVAAVYERAAPVEGQQEQARVDAEGKELPLMAYTTTFYPNTVKLSEALPVRLDYGQEVGGIDLFLRIVRKVKIHGRVTSGVSGQVLTNAPIVLQRMDSHNAGTLPAPSRATFDRNGRFEIKDVTPGPYLVTAEGTDAGQRLIGRAVVQVAEEDIDNLELMVTAERMWGGRVRIEGGGRLDSKTTISAVLEPRSERVAAVNADVQNLGFQGSVMGDEVYDLYIRNLPDDFYLSGVRVNGTEVMAWGLDAGLASAERPFEVVLDSRGGRVAGRVFGPGGSVWSGANMMLIPDPPQGRLQAYREASADEYGQFQIRGVAPGRYVLVAWLDDPPCDYYDPDGLDACRAMGMAVTVAQAGQENVMLQMKSAVRR